MNANQQYDTFMLPETTPRNSNHIPDGTFELNAGVCGCELPVGFGVMDVAMFLPCGNFVGQGLFVGDAAIQTLG